MSLPNTVPKRAWLGLAPAGDLAIMRRIDELHLEHPFADSRMLRDMLQREDVEVGRRLSRR